MLGTRLHGIGGARTSFADAAAITTDHGHRAVVAGSELRSCEPWAVIIPSVRERAEALNPTLTREHTDDGDDSDLQKSLPSKERGTPVFNNVQNLDNNVQNN